MDLRDLLQELIESWSAHARAFEEQGDIGLADGIFGCVDDLIELITPTPNELREQNGLPHPPPGS